MEKIVADEVILRMYPTLNECVHHESEIYKMGDDVLYKVLLYDNRLMRERTVRELGNYSNSFCCLPSGILYNENDEFIGLSMKYLKKYRNSDKIIFGDLSYKEKLLVARNVASAIEKMINDGILYWDVHFDNILYDMDGNIKVIDMDSVRFKSDYKPGGFESRTYDSYRLATEVILSYISKMNIMELTRSIGEDELLEVLNTVFDGEMITLLNSVFGYSSEIVPPSQILDSVHESDLIKLRKNMMKKFIK